MAKLELKLTGRTMGKETQPVMVTKKFDARAPHMVLLSPRCICTSQVVRLVLIFTLFLVEVAFVGLRFLSFLSYSSLPVFLTFAVDFSQIYPEGLRCDLVISLFCSAGCPINIAFPFPPCQRRDPRRDPSMLGVGGGRKNVEGGCKRPGSVWCLLMAEFTCGSGGGAGDEMGWRAHHFRGKEQGNGSLGSLTLLLLLLVEL